MQNKNKQWILYEPMNPTIYRKQRQKIKIKTSWLASFAIA